MVSLAIGDDLLGRPNAAFGQHSCQHSLGFEPQVVVMVYGLQPVQIDGPWNMAAAGAESLGPGVFFRCPHVQ